MPLGEKRQFNIIFRTISLVQRILRRVQTRNIDCSADNKPEELRAQEAPAIVKQNSRQETVPKKTCARILSQNTPCTFFYKPSVCIDFRLSGFPHVRHAEQSRHPELVSGSLSGMFYEMLNQVQHDVGRKAVVVC